MYDSSNEMTIEEYFPLNLVVTLDTTRYKLVLYFESVDEILECDAPIMQTTKL